MLYFFYWDSLHARLISHYITWSCKKKKSGVILETEGSAWKIQKGDFHYKKVKKGTNNLTSPYIHSIFTTVLIKQLFEKNKSLKAVSGSWTQF